jgi:predicted MFS family arabinose efflux permease
VLGGFAVAAVLLFVFLVAEINGRNPMFDLALFRKPTFTGGLVAAFGVSASIFSMLLYLTLYLQDVLGYSALQTGLRLLSASGAIFVFAAVSGRVSSHVPVQILIGPGLIVVAVGLLLMRGLDAGSAWTHLAPGLVVSGIGVGLMNPPLASTAVGVVAPRQAGMASGLNSSFRQVGIATGIALLGSLFASRMKSAAAEQLAVVPGLSHHAQRLITSSLTDGQLGHALAGLPPAQRGPVAIAARAAFVTGLNRILLVAAIVAVVSGLLCLQLIRSKDFVQHQPEAAPPA